MKSDAATFASISRSLGNKIRLNWTLVVTIAVLGYFVLRASSLEWKTRVGAGSMVGMFVEPVGNVLDNLFAGVLFALLAYVMRDTLSEWLRGVRTVKTLHFNSLEQCLKLLSEAIANYRNNVAQAHITMVSPLFLSHEYISYYYDSDKRYAAEDLRRAKKQRSKEYLHHFQEVMDLVIESGTGAYDKTLIGKTGIAGIDRATYQIAEKAYQMSDSAPPGTTELGFHSNLNEYATFIFGQCHKTLESEPIRFDFMLLVHFDTVFENLCGYICFDEETIKQNYEFLEFKNRSADKLVVSNNSNHLNQEEWSKFCSELRGFLIG